MSHSECHTADTGLYSRELNVDFRFWLPACNGQSIFQFPLVMGWYQEALFDINLLRFSKMNLLDWKMIYAYICLNVALKKRKLIFL